MSEKDNGSMVTMENGDREWRRYGEMHRADGPAAVRSDGTMEWWQHGRRHREDGPAITRTDGSEEWWRGGRLSRHLDRGPAVGPPEQVMGKTGDRLVFGEDGKDGPTVIRVDGVDFGWQNGLPMDSQMSSTDGGSSE